MTNQLFLQTVDAALEEAGFGDVRAPHANVFTFVPEQGIQVSELTRLAHVRKQTMSQVVDELERLGYVERRAHPTDRRARLVFLTARGKGVRPVAMAAGRRVEAQWARAAGAEQIESLRHALQSLLADLGEGLAADSDR